MSGLLATYDVAKEGHLPTYGKLLFEAKTAKGVTFEKLAQITGRTEVAIAALFYGQTTATPEDIDKLSAALDIPREALAKQLQGYPFRGQAGPMPPTEPLIYRLYEIIQTYGYAFKAVLNEKFGDGIMSGINFTTRVDAEVDDTGAKWAVITLRGKWLDYARF